MDALGRLTQVRQEDKTLASYRYNHRGERIGKTVQGKTTQVQSP
jgi:YD repeat-containing protein